VPFLEPYAGLGIRYSYLWKREQEAGREEGTKDRPCAVVMAIMDQDGEWEVLVLPITHSPPPDPADAIEIPAETKKRLGLDTDRSWIAPSTSQEAERNAHCHRERGVSGSARYARSPSSCLRGRCTETAWRIFPERAALEILHQSRYLDCGGEHERSLGDVYSPVFSRPLIDLPEPELVHPAEITGCEALIHPRFVDYLLGRHQQCCGFSSLELPH
jgi:hypothetical protein